jgi:hypothetical protein
MPPREELKTSYGMRAIDPRQGPPPVSDRPRRPDGSDLAAKQLHWRAMAVTGAFHGFVAVLIIAGAVLDRGHGTARADKYEPIEAGLAIKQKSTQGAKSRLPAKEVQQKVKEPDAPKVATDANVKPPEDKPKKDDAYVPPDARDAKSVMDKYRKMDTGDTSATDKNHADETNQAGSEQGSEYGTLVDPKGDPYIGELVGRMTKDFTVPTVVTAQGLQVWGCVKLDASGKILDRHVHPDHKSKSYALNSAVEARLKDTTNMEAPVPDKLKHQLVDIGICAIYSSDR